MNLNDEFCCFFVVVVVMNVEMLVILSMKSMCGIVFQQYTTVKQEYLLGSLSVDVFHLICFYVVVVYCFRFHVIGS